MNRPSFLVAGIDFILVNLLMAVFWHLHWNSGAHHGWYMCNVFFFICQLVYPPYAQHYFVRIEQIMSRVIHTVTLMFALIITYIAIDDHANFSPFCLGLEYSCSVVVLYYGRYFSNRLIRRYRRAPEHCYHVVFVGAGVNLAYLAQVMNDDLGTGYQVMGYFDSHHSSHLPESLPLLGNYSEVIPWLEEHHVDHLYCNLPSSRSEEILALISYCEKNCIRFFSVPNVHNYVHRSMTVTMVEDMPVLSLRREPLADRHNRFFKWVFDFSVSLFVTLFFLSWITVIVAIITKITMPGPIFFRQKRNGYLGKVFTCYKFRSMVVNKDADHVQATQHDPRKTWWGDIMRRTNIDELPQFINVLKGEMSIVGPRPHMVWHTQQYSALIDKYMVRHQVLPGITGWAQVTGARGETSELWQMEHRIVKDVWYIENWSFWLDMRIIYLTIRNCIFGDKQAY